MQRLATCLATLFFAWVAGAPLAAQTPAPNRPVSPDVAVPPPNGKPIDVKGVSELIDSFLRLCMNIFPDDAAVAARAKSESFQPLSKEELRRFLHDDPGSGWSFKQNDITLALTVELPPYHSCAVRTGMPTEPDIRIITAIAVGTWGATHEPKETMMAQQPQSIVRDGLTQEAQMFYLLGPDKKPLEAVGSFITHYPGKAAVEVRLVRMRGNNPH